MWAVLRAGWELGESVVDGDRYAAELVDDEVVSFIQESTQELVGA